MPSWNGNIALRGAGVSRRLNGCGTLFSYALSGSFTVLHSFQGPADGEEPISLLNQNGTLYGTAEQGASTANCGAVFTYAPASAAFSLLHVFAGPPADSCQPTSLALDGSTFYGTAGVVPLSEGSLFSMTQAGDTSVDVMFASSQGYGPIGPMLLGNGTFYSMTQQGGTHNEGVIFSYVP